MGNITTCMGRDPANRIKGPVWGGRNYARKQGKGIVRMIIVACDYERTGDPLTSTADAENMRELAAKCGFKCMLLYNDQCTKSMVTGAIREVGKQCSEDDFFVFYYSGHGVQVHDVDGDEADGLDEAFALVDSKGQVTDDSILVDDDFARVVTRAVPKETRVLVIADCCHAGTIADMGRSCWYGREALSITGCRDQQLSGDVGRGGIFTHSLLMGVAQMQKDKQLEYSVADLYNRTIENNQQVFGSKQQDIVLCTADGFYANQMAWPLIPKGQYTAPYHEGCSIS